MRTLSSLSTTSTTTTTTIKPIFPPPAATTTAQRSPWHSPMPYLFGGLAAMLSLIAFALLILACSFQRRSRSENGETDLEAAGDGEKTGKALPEFEEKYLVIMAGDVNPTFLATPVCTKTSSLGIGNHDSKVKTEEKADTTSDNDNKPKEDMGLDDRMVIPTEEDGTDSESENRAQENSDN